MIRSIDNRLSTAAATTRAAAVQRPARASTGAAKTPDDFQKLVKSPAAATPASAATSQATPGKLGPFVEGPFYPATPAPPAPAKIASSPWLPPGTPGDQNLMNPAEHEATMNAWLQNYTQWTNDKKTQIYQQALGDWQLNNQRCQDLGIEAPPKPTPPALDPLQNMPTGWWFKFQG